MNISRLKITTQTWAYIITGIAIAGFLVLIFTAARSAPPTLADQIRALQNSKVTDTTMFRLREEIVMEKSNWLYDSKNPMAGLDARRYSLNGTIKEYNILRTQMSEEDQRKFPPIEYISAQ